MNDYTMWMPISKQTGWKLNEYFFGMKNSRKMKILLKQMIMNGDF